MTIKFERLISTGEGYLQTFFQKDIFVKKVKK